MWLVSEAFQECNSCDSVEVYTYYSIEQVTRVRNLSWTIHNSLCYTHTVNSVLYTDTFTILYMHIFCQLDLNTR